MDRGVLFPLNCQLNKVEILCFLHGIARRTFFKLLQIYKFSNSFAYFLLFLGAGYLPVQVS